MNTPKTKTHQYTLYDQKVSQEELLKFMSQTFQLVEKNAKKFKGIDDPLAMFHNKTHHYSGIQFGIEGGALSIRAYGEEEIKALKIWWKLYREHHAFNPQNLQICKEKYTLGFLPSLQTYRLSNFLVNREKRQQLAQTKEKAEINQILADYVVANFFPFFNHLGYRHDREKQEIIVNLLKVKRQRKSHTVFRGGKRQAYDLIFESNLRLPHLFRMGEATAMGFGNLEWKK